MILEEKCWLISVIKVASLQRWKSLLCSQLTFLLGLTLIIFGGRGGGEIEPFDEIYMYIYHIYFNTLEVIHVHAAVWSSNLLGDDWINIIYIYICFWAKQAGDRGKPFLEKYCTEITMFLYVVIENRNFKNHKKKLLRCTEIYLINFTSVKR